MSIAYTDLFYVLESMAMYKVLMIMLIVMAHSVVLAMIRDGCLVQYCQPTPSWACRRLRPVPALLLSSHPRCALRQDTTARLHAHHRATTRRRWSCPLPAARSCWAVLPRCVLYATPGNNVGLGNGHRYLALPGVAMCTSNASALALHRMVDGAQWAPLRVLDLWTASNCLLHALLWRLWAAGVAAIRVGVDHWAITSANANRVLSSLPATSDVRGGSSSQCRLPLSPRRWTITVQRCQAGRLH